MADIINKEKILEHAKKLIGEGKLDRAIAEYERLLQLDPGDLRIKIKIAELYVKRKQIQDAIRIYTEVANGYADGGFYLKAVTVYKSVLRLNPSLIHVNIALSELYEKMGLIQDALYQYQIVATSLEQKNDLAKVLDIRERMVALDQSNVALRVRLAETYQLQGMVDKSIDMYEALAGQLKDSGDTDQLIELYNKVLSHRPLRHDLVTALCHMYFKRGEWKEILKKMDAAKEFVAGDPELLAMQADIYTRLNQIETAKGKYRDLAELLNDQGDIDGALAAYENILFLGPENEDEISKEVETIKEGAFSTVKAHVNERRKKVEEEEKRREEEAMIQGEAAAKTEETAKRLGVKPGEITMSHEEAGKLEKEGNAGHDLGLMYKKMGLLDESHAEFAKALKVYQRLVASGNASEKSIARMHELEALLPEAKTVKPAAKPLQEARPTRPAKQEKPDKKKISFI